MAALFLSPEVSGAGARRERDCNPLLLILLATQTGARTVEGFETIVATELIHCFLHISTVTYQIVKGKDMTIMMRKRDNKLLLQPYTYAWNIFSFPWSADT